MVGWLWRGGCIPISGIGGGEALAEAELIADCRRNHHLGWGEDGCGVVEYLEVIATTYQRECLHDIWTIDIGQSLDPIHQSIQQTPKVNMKREYTRHELSIYLSLYTQGLSTFASSSTDILSESPSSMNFIFPSLLSGWKHLPRRGDKALTNLSCTNILLLA